MQVHGTARSYERRWARRATQRLLALQGMRKAFVCWGFAVAGLLVSAAAAGAGLAARTAAWECPPPGGHVKLSDRQAVVYTIRETEIATLEGEHYEVHPTGIRGCVRGGQRSYKLGRPAEGYGGGGEGASGAGLNHVVLAGSYAAFASDITSESGEGFGEYWIVVRSVRDGRVLYHVPNGALSVPRPRDVGTGETTAIVLKSDGAVAWIALAEPTEGFVQVHALDRTGSRLLAKGRNIAPESLKLRGSRVYWREGEKLMSAVLR